MCDKALNITPKENYIKPCSQGFWYDLEAGDEDKFLELIEDEETRNYFKQSIRNLRWLENGIEDLVEWY